MRGSGRSWTQLARTAGWSLASIRRPRSGRGTLIFHGGWPFACRLNKGTTTGLPDAAEYQQLRLVEDIVLREVAVRTRGVFGLTLTDGRMRELVFYVPPGADWGELHRAVQGQVVTHDVQCVAEPEPGWDAYDYFSPRTVQAEVKAKDRSRRS
ncbi:MAG: DUF695 domain-containing protein [Dehalococcoidia bacterium]